jgi:rhodanese-related sulfurtransferase
VSDAAQSGPAGERGLLRASLGIALTGCVLGLVYNALGLRNETWGLEWVAEDRTDMPQLADPAPTAVAPADSDDPMAIPGPAAASDGVPEIPDLGRPIQVQLPAVKRFFDAGAVVFVDAREHDEYVSGHIAGAVHLPFEEAVTDPARLEALQTLGKPIVTYCGGGTCELSINLAHALVQAGHRKVLVFMGGYPEWANAGYPIDTGDRGATGRLGVEP